MTITLRTQKGSELTFQELDNNFTDLDGRVTTLESAPDSDSQTLTLAGDDLTITGGNTVSLSTLSTEVVDDTSPQLGGNLDLNGKEITSSGGSAITEILDVLLLSGGNNGIIMRTKTSAGKIVIGDQAGDIVLGNSSNSVEFVNDVDVDFTNTNIDFTNATITGLSIVQGIDDLSDVDTSTTPPGVGQVLKWDGAQWEPADDSSGSGGAPLAFVGISVDGQTQVLADGNADTLTFEAGAGMTITTDSSTDKIIFAQTGGATTWALLGDKAGANGPQSIALGNGAGGTLDGTIAQESAGVAIGLMAGRTDQKNNSVAIGTSAGNNTQGQDSVAIGEVAGTMTQGESSVAIGSAAGTITQGSEAIAIGKEAGAGTQGTQAVAIGSYAGGSIQGITAVAVGMQSGEFYQGGGAVAVGLSGGGYIQGQQAVAIGLGAGENVQEPKSIAIGVAAGGGQHYQKTYVSHAGTNLELSDTAGLIVGAKISNTLGVTAGTEITAIVDSTNVTLNQGLTGTPAASGVNFHQKGQGAESVAIGLDAGQISQGDKTVAVGAYAGEDTQGTYGVAVGWEAGKTTQGNTAIAIGYQSGLTTQGADAIAIGDIAGMTTQGQNAVALGYSAARTNQGVASIAIGANTGLTNQGADAIAIGQDAGQISQGADAIAIGQDAGETTQGTYGIALGTQAGETTQGTGGIAIGYQAGQTNQDTGTIAIGSTAGTTTQGEDAVAVGTNAGKTTQGTDAVAIGHSAGETSQGAGAIAIGYNAGSTNQAANSIVINAGGLALENTQTGSFVVKPIRNRGGTHALEYDPATGEVTYDTLGGGGSGLQSRGGVTGTTSSLADAAQADLDITGFKSYALLTITTDKAARVRLYVNAATRTADAARAEGIDPTSDAGVIAEVITTGAETVIISPGAIGFNLESSPTTNIPCRVTNKSGSTGTVQVGLNILQLEA